MMPTKRKLDRRVGRSGLPALEPIEFGDGGNQGLSPRLRVDRRQVADDSGAGVMTQKMGTLQAQAIEHRNECIRMGMGWTQRAYDG